MSRRASHVAFACALAAVVVASSPLARAQGTPASEIEACASAAEESQPLRNAGKLSSAREKLVVCARPVCHAAIRKDCEKWLADVDAIVPSVIFRVVDPKGKDVTKVRVSVDGALLTEKLDGRPVNVDPGEHTFSYESEGQQTVTEKLLIRQGEKGRLVSAAFPAPTEKPVEPTPPTTKPSEGGIPTISWVLGGIGVVGVGVGVGFWAAGTSAHSDMESGCAKIPSCSQSDVDSAKTKLLVGDVAMVVGVGAIGAGVVFAILAKKPAATSGLDLRPVAGGGAATFGGHF